MATATLVLDGVISATNLTGATVANLNAVDANWAAVTDSAAGTDLIVSMPSPAGNLNAGAGLQTITIQARKSATGGSPASFTIAIREGGVDKAVSAAIPVASAVSETHTFTWDAAILANPSGADVEVHLVGLASGGKPADRRSIGFGFIKWDTNHSIAPAGLTGTLVARDAGTDGFAATGTVAFPSGTLTVAESGTDTFAAVGSVGAGVLTLTGTPTDAEYGAAYSWTPTTSGGSEPYSYALTDGALPDGLTLDPATGEISGTATLAGLALNGTAPDGTFGEAYTFTPTVSGGEAPYSFAITEGALPDGLTINTATGEISGTPVEATGGITGALAAVEAGSDTFAAAGSVVWATRTGALDAVEAGNDNAAATGSVAVAGSLTAQETGADDFTATTAIADPTINGTLATTETGADDLTATATVAISGDLTAPESGSDALTGWGSVTVAGALSAAETGNDDFTAVATPDPAITGSLAAQDSGTDSFIASGAVSYAGIAGALAADEIGSDGFTATGSLGAVPINGNMAAQEAANDNFAGVGEAEIAADLIARETGFDQLAVSGLVLIEGGLSTQETSHDIFQAFQQLPRQSTVSRFAETAAQERLIGQNVKRPADVQTAKRMGSTMSARPRAVSSGRR